MVRLRPVSHSTPDLGGLALVLDACSRKMVGWAMENHLKTELVLAAINMGLAQRRPQGVIHHSDSEYMDAGSFFVV